MISFTPCNRIHRGICIGFRVPPSGFRIPTFWILDSNPLDSGFHPLDSGFQPSGFRIPTLWIPDSTFWIPDSTLWIPDSTHWIPDSNPLDSGLHPLDSGFQSSGFRIPTLWIPDSKPLDSGLQTSGFLSLWLFDFLSISFPVIQWNSDFSNLQGKWKLIRKIRSSKNRRWHQIAPV